MSESPKPRIPVNAEQNQLQLSLDKRQLTTQQPEQVPGEANIKVAVRFRPMLANEMENLGFQHLGNKLTLENNRV